jgi:cobalamin biosynthesis protein CbiG
MKKQSKNDHLGAVMLWRRANKSTEAARMLATLAEQVAAQAVDPLRAKKLQVYTPGGVDG